MKKYFKEVMLGLFVVANIVVVGGYELKSQSSQPPPLPVYTQVLSHIPGNAQDKADYKRQFSFYRLTGALAVIKQEVTNRDIGQHGIHELTMITHKLSHFPHSIHWTPDMGQQLRMTVDDWDWSDGLPDAVKQDNPEIRLELKTAASALVKVLKHLCYH